MTNLNREQAPPEITYSPVSDAIYVGADPTLGYVYRLSPTPEAERVEIPAGMVPWHGGDSAPADWDGGRVLILGLTRTMFVPGEGARWKHLGRASDIIAYPRRPSNDPAAGSAGESEGDRYLDGYAEGSAAAARDTVWMQDKAWMDAVLMLVHYRTAAERTWLVGHEEAAAKLAEWWKIAQALSDTKNADDIAALHATQDSRDVAGAEAMREALERIAAVQGDPISADIARAALDIHTTEGAA